MPIVSQKFVPGFGFRAAAGVFFAGDGCHLRPVEFQNDYPIATGNVSSSPVLD